MFSLISDADAHPLFNSGEEWIGDYRIQIATLPEIPAVDEKIQVLLRVVDVDFQELENFTLGIRIFYHGEQVGAIMPTIYQNGHVEIDYIFENLIIYTGSSIAFAFVTIFVPILLFEKVFKKKINWKPAIYLLVVWFLFLEIKTGQEILSTEIVGHAAPLAAKIIPIIGNFLGLFGTLYYAYKYTENK